MLKFLLTVIVVIMLAVMITAMVGLFYSAIAEDVIQNYIYGAAVDLSSCMLIFRGDPQYVEFAYIVSLVAVAIVACSVSVYKKLKTPKEVQN